MAQPPLEYQIEHLDRIVVCVTAAEGAFTVEEVWKGSRGPSSFTPDVETFKRLGYAPVVGERAVLFATAAGQVVELLPVKNGWVDYAPSDESVRRRLALHELKALARGPDSRAPGGRQTSKTAFWVLTFFAGLAVFLALREIASSREAARLFETGSRVTGRCEGLSPKHPFRISYRFDVDGTRYEALGRPVAPEAREKLKVGDPVEVYYDPARPSRNVSEPERSIQGSTSPGVFLLFGLAAAFFAGGLFLLRVGGIPDAYRR